MALADYLNVVVDLSHHNGNVDMEKARAAGTVGIIQKATQGLAYVDPFFVTNKTQAMAAGLLWGAYHFGVAGDGVAQAEEFLSVVEPGPRDLLVLDFEANPQGPTMSLEEARAFVTHVFTVVGRWPGLYAGHHLKELLGSQSDSVLANCWFWLSVSYLSGWQFWPCSRPTGPEVSSGPMS